MKFARVLAVAAVAALTCSSPALAVFDLQLTEVYEGVSGDDITEDWVEITNFGDMAYTFGVDGQLYYDDSSADPTEDEQVTGITDIQPGESVVVVLGNAASDVTDFVNAWGAANLVGVEIGFLIGDDPGGLSQGGESLFFFDDNTALANTVITGSYTGVDNGGAIAGSTWTGIGDLVDQSVDGVNGAFTATVGAGDFGTIPLVGSPGTYIPEPSSIAIMVLGALGLAGFAVRRRR